MARFIASIDSSKNGVGSASRLMPSQSHTRGWHAGVKVTTGSNHADRDELTVYMTGGSSGGTRDQLLGTVTDTNEGPRWTPADAPGRVPAKVGSPAMTVVAAIPVGAHKNNPEPDEYICAVHTRTASYGGRKSYFGTVHAYRNDGDPKWHADAGNYDMSQVAAITDMIRRAGFERPQISDPGYRE